MLSDWIVILPQIILGMGGFLILCVGAFWRRRPSGVLFGMALLFALASCIVGVVLKPPVETFVSMLDGSGYARFFTVLLSLIAIISVFFAYHYAKLRDFSGDEFYALIIFATLGMLLTSSAIHWVVFFLGLELLSISLYILIAIRKGDQGSNEAALKYFIMGAVASAFLTFGIAILYAVTGKMNIAQSLGSDVVVSNSMGVLLGFGLILVGIGFKVSLVPFHLWTPDVYQGTPAPITAFLSTGSKVALFAAFLRFAMVASDGLWVYFMPVLWVTAVLTMVVGNVTALTQIHLKRLLAYSSIAHMGYMLMALLAVKVNGASAVMFYSAVYALMDLGAFGTVGLLSAKEADIDQLDSFAGLGYSHPWVSGLLAVSLFSLAGLPPTAGFVGKFVVFRAALQANFIILAVIGILTAIVSVYFYLKVIVILYMSAEESAAAPPRAGFCGDLACGVVLVLLFWLGIFPASTLETISKIVSLFTA